MIDWLQNKALGEWLWLQNRALGEWCNSISVKPCGLCHTPCLACVQREEPTEPVPERGAGSDRAGLRQPSRGAVQDQASSADAASLQRGGSGFRWCMWSRAGPCWWSAGLLVYTQHRMISIVVCVFISTQWVWCEWAKRSRNCMS